MSHLVLEFLFRTRANAVYLVVSAFLMLVQISHCFIQGRTHTHFSIVLFPLLEFDLESVKENMPEFLSFQVLFKFIVLGFFDSTFPLVLVLLV